jgi:DNA ligase-1
VVESKERYAIINRAWLMIDYLEGLGDSLDLVPIGAWWGQGRKAGWWSPILLACHNPETGALEAVCKCQFPLLDHEAY